MQLHGKTTIELFDAESGRLQEIIENENTVTGAITEVFRGIGRFGASDPLNYGDNSNTYFNFRGRTIKSFDLTQWLGGLLCFDTPQDPLHPFGLAESNIVASGVFNTANIGANNKRGSFNTVESLFDWEQHRISFVYDFVSSQGNGTISSVCLTPLLGGYMCECDTRTESSLVGLPLDECYQPNVINEYGTFASSGSNDTNPPVGWLPLFGYAAKEHKFYEELWEDLVPSRDSYYPLDSNYMGVGGVEKIIELDQQNNAVVKAKIELDSARIYVTISRYPLACNKINVWHGNGDNSPQPISSTRFEVGTAAYNHMGFIFSNYDYENRILYVVSAPFDIRNYTGDSFKYSSKNGADVNSTIKVFAISIDPSISGGTETYEVNTYSVVNNTNVTLPTYSMMRAMPEYSESLQFRGLQFYCYDGYMYVYGPIYNTGWCETSQNYTIYKIEIAHPSNVVQVQTDLETFPPAGALVFDAHDGRIYLTVRTNVLTPSQGAYEAVRVLNTSTNELYAFEELLHADYKQLSIVPVRGNNALATINGHLIGLRPNVLMTVNNISPVTKTALQTMKIKYTISE